MGSYRDIALYLKRRLDSDTDRLVVVVSAMSGTTGRILEAGLEVSPELSPEITDSLLGTGEMVAACLLRAAVEAVGVRAMHFTGYQLGLHTDRKYTRAAIHEFDSRPLREALDAASAVVLAGGQGRDSQGRLTMLGRNSSDLTAVAVAAALGLSECEIFSDVPGVYSSDPYEIPEAQLIPEVPYEAIIEMSRSGAKVLHHGSVEYAKRFSVRIVCRATPPNDFVGSVVGKGPLTNSVTINKKTTVLRFRLLQHQEGAAKLFNSEGIVAIPLVCADATYLVVSHENRAWQEVLTRIAWRYEIVPNHVLITEAYSNGTLVRNLCTPNEATALARRAHSLMYGESPDAAAAPLTKERSSRSDLLVAAL
jgi:aspartate kinase